MKALCLLVCPPLSHVIKSQRHIYIPAPNNVRLVQGATQGFKLHVCMCVYKGERERVQRVTGEGVTPVLILQMLFVLNDLMY